MEELAAAGHLTPDLAHDFGQFVAALGNGTGQVNAEEHGIRLRLLVRVTVVRKDLHPSQAQLEAEAQEFCDSCQIGCINGTW